MEHHAFDVIVIGAGIAGATADPVRVRPAEIALTGSGIEAVSPLHLGEIVRSFLSAEASDRLAGGHRREVAVAAVERLFRRLRSSNREGPRS
jgi:hypothetical protein